MYYIFIKGGNTLKFYKWYTQALGYITAMISCIYCYLIGDLLLYHNLSGNYDHLGLNQILASYTLYPLCIITFFLTLLVGLIPQYSEKKVLNIKIIKINNFLKYLLIIIGVLGCGIYFILPTLIILLGDFISLIMIIINKIPRKEKDNTKDTNSIKDNVEDFVTKEELGGGDFDFVKNEIAMNLLEKDSDINFICDITGFSKDYIKKLKKEALVSNNEK